MLRQVTKHRMLKIRMLKVFNALGLWSIPVLSIPVLLPVVVAQSISWPLQSARSGVSTAEANVTTQPIPNQSLSQKLAALTGQVPANAPPMTQTTATRPVTPQPTAQPKSTPAKPVAKSTPTKKTTAAAPRSNPAIRQAIAQEPPAIELQVKVAESDLIPVSTSTNGVIVDDSGRVLRSVPAMQPIYAQASSQGISLNDWDAPASVWLQANDGGFVFAGEHWYRGRVRLIVTQNKLLAVNHVDLEDYLPSVVGSEMYHDWSIEALKAQAVAARSYALVYYIRPASTYYQIGADQYYQVYKGLTSEGTNPWEAVRETTGQVLSYKGGVVESLYASSDELVAEVHKGFGMSQQGAQKLASQGYSYLQILGSYYPGTTLAQLKPY